MTPTYAFSGSWSEKIAWEKWCNFGEKKPREAWKINQTNDYDEDFIWSKTWLLNVDLENWKADYKNILRDYAQASTWSWLIIRFNGVFIPYNSSEKF